MAGTQTVTVLFTDIVGSTALSSRLASAEADQVRQTHFSLLRQALAASAGTEVKTLGDGLMAVFPNASAAVGCAVSMQQAVEQDNRRASTPIGLRVGLSGGEVTSEQGDYFGDPVVEASRICALCEAGQVLSTDTVRSLAGRRSPHRFIDVGERELKGIPDPVPVFEVPWEPVSGTSGIPLPDRLEIPSDSLFGFIGREAELASLIEDLKHSAEGSRHVRFLSGEPGIGKTSLCKEVARAASERGMCVLYGRCDEELVVSYQPFAEALGHLVVHGDEALLEAHVEENGAALVSLVPALAKRIPSLPESGGDPDSERLRLFSAAVSLLTAASERGVLLVIDDLHWADKASLQLLKHLCASHRLPRLMVLGTYRDSELSAGNPLSDTLASVGREANVERIDLVGLADVEILRMMERVAGHEMDQEGVDLAHAVRRETEGNPFFTTELLRHLGESGLVHQDETGRWVASSDLYEKGLPQSVRAVVGQRVDRLGEDTRRVLSQAAVIGRDFDIEVLGLVVGMEEDLLLDLVDNATRAGLLVEVDGIVDRFSFAHALTQHTLYEDLGASRRARVHRKIADALEQVYGAAPEARAAELARHFVAATKTADAMKALSYCKLAADQALAQLAPADALGWFVQALELYPQIPSDDGLRCDLLNGLGTAQRRTGDPAHRQTLLEAATIAISLGDSQRLIASAIANTRGSVTTAGQVDDDKVAVLEQALGAVGPDDSSERVRLLAILSEELEFGADSDRYAAVTTEALAIARRLDDPLCTVQVALMFGSRYTPDTVEDRRAALLPAAAIAEEVGDLRAAFTASVLLTVACLQAADRPQWDTYVAKASAIAERISEPFESWQALTVRSMQSLLEGDPGRALEQTEAAMPIGAESVPEAMAVFGSQLKDIYRIRGDWTELAGIAELMAAAAAQNPGLPVLRAALARTFCDLGHGSDASALVDEDISNGFADYSYDSAWMSAATALSETCVYLQRADGAAILYDWLSPWHGQLAQAMVTCQGPVAFHLGCLATLLERPAAAAGHFAEALEVSQRMGFPYWQARTQIECALLARRSPATAIDSADTMFAAALDTARRYGFRGLIGVIETESGGTGR
jgi:class 3 adenylate cyclase